MMFLETETEKDKHCNVWTRKSKSKGPREKSRPSERYSERCRSSERSRGREKSRPKERARYRGVRMHDGCIPRAARTVVSDEIRATIIDHVINHGLSLREAGERVQPNLRRSTVASIIRIFQQTNR